MGVLLEKVEITFICFIVVDTIQGAFGFLEARNNLWEKKIHTAKTSSPQNFTRCGFFLIALVIIDISFDLYLSIASDSIEIHTLTNDGKLFNEWIIRKLQKQWKNE